MYYSRNVFITILFAFLIFFVAHAVYSNPATNTPVQFEENIKNTNTHTSYRKLPTDTTTEGLSDLMLYQTLANISGEMPPFTYGTYMVFTYYDRTENTRVYFADAKDHYAYLYPFKRIATNKRVLVFLYPRSYEPEELQYRLVINDEWMVDPQNPRSTVDIYNIKISTVLVKARPPLFLPSMRQINDTTIRITITLDNHIQDIYNTYLQKVYTYQIQYHTIFLTADFTGWDPFLLPMTPVHNQKDTYYVDVTLTQPGKYHYYFQAGNTSILDPKNRRVSKHHAGHYVNILEIQTITKETTGATVPVLVTTNGTF